MLLAPDSPGHDGPDWLRVTRSMNLGEEGWRACCVKAELPERSRLSEVLRLVREKTKQREFDFAYIKAIKEAERLLKKERRRLAKMTIKEIAERNGVSERTARRRMEGVEPRRTFKSGSHDVADYRVADVRVAFKK